MERVTYGDWHNRGVALYGPSRLDWQFKCPQCSNVQRVSDFIPLRQRGGRPELAYTCCIGRFNGHIEDNTLPGCMFTVGTRPELAAVEVEYGKGHKTLVMAFAEE